MDKSLFLSVLDEKGKPVKDIVADDILIREDGADRQVVAVKPASTPISVAVLVDTSQGTRVTDAYGTPEEYVRDLRVAVARVREAAPRAEPERVGLAHGIRPGRHHDGEVHHRPDGIRRRGSTASCRGPASDPVLGEALEAANKDLAQRPGGRRAIVSVNLEPSNEQSFENAKPIMDAFRKSGAQLWAVSIHRGKLKNSKRDVVLNDFSKLSGGQRDFIVGISAVEGILKGYADALVYQYEVVYKRPESNKETKVIQVGTRATGREAARQRLPPEVETGDRPLSVDRRSGEFLFQEDSS